MAYLDEYMSDFFFDKSQIFRFFAVDKASNDLSKGQTFKIQNLQKFLAM
jgi:hypothetical protein